MSDNGSNTARIAVIGAGAVGSYFAGRAAMAGNDVTLCVRSPRPGVVIRSGGDEWRPDVRVVSDPGDVGDVDWVLLATKAHQTAGAAPWLTALDHGAPLVLLQNGVRHTDRVDGLWTGEAFASVVMCAVEQVEPGVVVHHSYGWFSVQDGPRTQALAAAFGPDQREVRLVPDVARSAWEKLVSNSAANSITALTARRVDVLAEPSVGDLALAVMRECVAVATADGSPLPPDLPEKVLERLRGMPSEQGSSMLYDRLAGVELEQEALIGTMVAIGAEHGVPTPAGSALLALLRAVSGRPIAPA